MTPAAIRRPTRGLSLGICLTLVLLHVPAARAEEPGDLEAARAPIRTLYGVLLDCMKNADSLGLEGRRARMGAALEAAYDFDFMARKALGRHWKKLDEDQRQRWRDAFTRMTVNTYAVRFNGFSGETLEVESAEPSTRGTVVVRTRIHPADDAPVTVNYRMRQRGGQWKAIDVYLKGTVSELALRRSEYTSALERDGFEALLASVLKKAESTEVGEG